MECIVKLHGTTVGLDSAPLIYFIERHPTYLPLVRPFFEAVERGEIQVATSALTLTEVLVHPYKRGNRFLAQQYSRILLHTRNLRTVHVSPEIATEAAQMRAAYGLKTPDAIQLATAQVSGATSFLTNDMGLAPISGLQLILLDRVLTQP
jgi:predicted nucleic acid-binding protein